MTQALDQFSCCEKANWVTFEMKVVQGTFYVSHMINENVIAFQNSTFKLNQNIYYNQNIMIN